MVRTISVRVLAEVEPGRVATRGARAESDFLGTAGADDVQLRVAQLRLARPRMVKEQDETATSPPDAAETESSGEGEVGGAAPSLHPFNDQVRPPSGYRQSRRRPAPSRASAPPGRDGCRRGQSTSGRTGQRCCLKTSSRHHQVEPNNHPMEDHKTRTWNVHSVNSLPASSFTTSGLSGQYLGSKLRRSKVFGSECIQVRRASSIHSHCSARASLEAGRKGLAWRSWP